MTIQGDTDDLISTSLWGEVVTVVRNTPTYGGDGAPTDVWASIGTPNADIQTFDSAVSGGVSTTEVGQMKLSTHKIFLPFAFDARQGDRIRPSGWSTGDDEHHVDLVASFEDHVEVLTHIVKGHA